MFSHEADVGVKAYRGVVREHPQFVEYFRQATPEQELGRLPLGSRPAKRREGGVESLRAIPWILAWTQTRLMLPAWLGWVLGGLLATFAGAVSDVAERGGRATALNRMLMHLVPEQFVGPGHVPAEDAYLRTLKIIDFISGMTDSYAVSLFKRITSMSLPMQ